MVAVVSADYGWVMLVGACTFFLNLVQIFMLGRARKKHDIYPPKMFSEECDEFNCAIRVHQNTLELTPFFHLNLAMAGIGYPIIAASFGLVYLVGRIIYSIGYYILPKGRFPGFIITMLGGIVPLVALNIASAGKVLGWWD